MNTLLMPVLGVITEALACYDPMSFGLKVDDFAGYATLYFQKRLASLEKAHGASLDEIYQVTQAAIDTMLIHYM